MTDSEERFRQEHEQINALLERAQTQDPMRLPAALKELHNLLMQHCSREEAPGGLFDHVLQKAPQFGPQLAKLRAEHTTLLAELLELSYRRRTDEKMRHDVDAFRQRLDEHEDMERDLFAGLLPDGSS